MSASLAGSLYPSRRRPLAACVAALFGLSSSPALHAGTVQVTNCSDGVVLGSLPWAATQAVNPGDIIDMTGISDFSSCFHNKNGFAQSIVLVSAVTVATGVTINGPNTSGSKALAVSTNTFDRVFYSPGYLTINNLGIKYGTATTAIDTSVGPTVYGGCVFARGGASLSGVVLDHCTANATGGAKAMGGSIGISIGPIVLTSSTITHSAATSSSGNVYGGGLFARNGDVTLTGSYVSGTASSQNGSALGGGIAGNTVSLTNSDVKNSYAIAFGSAQTARGGGILGAGKVTLANSTVRGAGAYQYTANGGPAAGGCIFAEQGVDLSDNSLVTGCGAFTASNGNARGGGIYSRADVTLQQSVLEFTEASSEGGSARGGGIFSVGGIASAYSSVHYSSAYSSSGISAGGAIFSEGGLQFKYGTIAASQADDGGAIFVGSGDLYLRGATLSDNRAKFDGSGLVMISGGASSTAAMINSTISGNTVDSPGGVYAVHIYANSTRLYNSTIAYNTGGTGAGTLLTGSAGSTAGLYSMLMSSNSLSNGTQNDFAKAANVTFTPGSSNNLIRHPGSIVPTGTLTGAAACPHLHKLAYNGGPTATHRLGGVIHAAGKNPAIDTGSNPKALKPDQRGGYYLATAPARVSGSAADIGAYEVSQVDVVFDTDFETCPN
jgi:hypothetical protein